VRDFEPGSGTVHVRESKSGNGRRVPLDDEGLAFFRAVTAGRPGRERVFLRSDGSSWIKDWQLRPIAEASAAARLDPPATFHSLRHSFASLRAMAGMPLPALAAVLGHTTTRMVELHYGHFAPGWVRDHVRATALGIGAGDEATTLVPLEQHRL
jgi:integrase